MSELVDKQAVLKVIRDMPYIGLGEKEALLDAVKGLPSAEPSIDKQELLRMITRGIFATSDKDIYSCGIRNGMRWCMALLEEDAPKFEDASLYVRQERKKGHWVVDEDGNIECSECGHSGVGDNYCERCGAEMERRQND